MTTDSSHGRNVYPNLARQMVLTDVDQLWRADITYIRLREEFVYLAVVLDAYSRRVIGWALDRTLEDELAMAALRMAFRRALRRGWCIIPTVACNTPLTTTRVCSKNTGRGSA